MDTSRITDLLKVLVYPTLVYLNIDKTVIGILTGLMVIDSVVGSIKAYRIRHSFSFKTLLWGYVLKILLFLIPTTIALMGKGLGYDFRILVDTLIKIMIVSEGYSIIGNIYAAKNKIEAPKLDIISMMLKAITRRMETSIKLFIKSIQDHSDCKIMDDDEDLDPT